MLFPLAAALRVCAIKDFSAKNMDKSSGQPVFHFELEKKSLTTCNKLTCISI